MFGRVKKINKNYYVSPLPENYLAKAAVRASVIAIAAVILFIPEFVLWIYPGYGCLLWIYGLFEAQIAYWALFCGTGIGLAVCAVMSFYGYKIRKEVKQSGAPTLGFRKSSYNGIFFTALLATLMLVYQIVLLIGYHVAVGNGYIAELISKFPEQLGEKTIATDVSGIVGAAFYALTTAAAWAYYVYTYRINRTMQLVLPDDGKKPDDTPAVPDKKEAELHRPPSPFLLTSEEKELGKREFEDSGDAGDKNKDKDKKQ